MLWGTQSSKCRSETWVQIIFSLIRLCLLRSLMQVSSLSRWNIQMHHRRLAMITWCATGNENVVIHYMKGNYDFFKCIHLYLQCWRSKTSTLRVAERSTKVSMLTSKPWPILFCNTALCLNRRKSDLHYALSWETHASGLLLSQSLLAF